MNKSLMRTFLLLCVLIGGVSISAYGGVTGRIAGKIVDAQSGEPVVGVSVSLVGTNLGGISDENGMYYILQVSVGTHSLKFSSMGFTTVTVEDINVHADETETFDMDLSAAAEELDEGITIVAPRPLVEKGRSMSVTVVTAEKIEQLPTRGYQQVVQLQSGVVTFRPNPGNRARGGRENTTVAEINIRGGRPTSVAYLVDGFSQQDPLSGLSTTAINNNSIQEVSIMTGGFPAEYGLVSAGVVNTITKSGSQDFHFSGEALGDRILGTNGFGLETYATDFGGPLTEKGDFYFSGERRWFDDRTPSPLTQDVVPASLAGGSDKRLPNNWLSGWTGLGKVRYNFSRDIRFQATGNYSREKWTQYRHDQLFNSVHNSRVEDKNYSFFGKWTHTLSPATFYELSGGYFQTERERGDGLRFDDLANYTDDEFDSTTLFYLPGATRVPGGYLHRISSYVQFKGDITSQAHPLHLIKAGVDYQRHTLRRYNHIVPFRVNSGVDSAAKFQDLNYYGFTADGQAVDPNDGRNDTKHPINFAAYFQDRFNWSGMVINAGLRFDYFDNNTQVFKDPVNPFGLVTNTTLDPEDLEDANTESRISPRLGVGFPLDERTNMHFSYGKQFKRPDLDKVYVGFDYVEFKIPASGYYFPVGNPNLRPEKTTAYEVGLSRQIGENTAFDVTAFYKDIRDLIQVIDQASTNPRSFSVYRNTDFATVKGFEAALRMRRTRSIALNLKYTLSSAKGTGSFAGTQRNIAWTSTNAPLQPSPLDFDVRHSFIGNIDIRASEGGGPRLGESHPLENAGLSAVVRYSTGGPFTSVEIYNEVTLAAVSPVVAGPINSANGPSTFTVDVKADKSFRLGDYNINAYVWVLNLFDRKNPAFVYESSGRPNTTGWLATPDGQAFLAANPVDNRLQSTMSAQQLYEIRENDPTNYANPRVIQFGLKFYY